MTQQSFIEKTKLNALAYIFIDDNHPLNVVISPFLIAIRFLRLFCLIAILLVCVKHVYAETEIKSFSPSAGWAGTNDHNGTIVRIKGSGFSGDMDLGDVYFSNHIKAIKIPSKQVNYIFDKVFGSRGSASGQIFGAQGIAIDDQTGNIYVVNQLPNGRVEVFGEDGDFIKQMGVDSIYNPQDVAVDKQGNIYVSDYNPPGDSGIIVLDSNDEIKNFIGGSSELIKPYSISLDDRGYIFVIDLEPITAPFPQYPEFVLFDDQGDKQLSFNGISEEWGPDVRIAVDPRPDPNPNAFDRTFYVSDRNKKRIYKYNTHDPILDQWDFSGSDAVNNVVVDADGYVYVDLGNNGIAKFKESGELISTVIPDTKQGRLRLRAVDKYKRIYLAEYNYSGEFVTIQVYKPEDSDEILVRVPPGAETGPISLQGLGPYPIESKEDFTVFQDLSPVSVSKVELTQGIKTYRLVAGKETLIWAKLTGIFGNPSRDSAVVTINRFDGTQFEHNADHYEYKYGTNETVVHFHIPTSIIDLAGKYSFDVAITRKDTALQYPQKIDAEFHDMKTPNLFFVMFTDIPESEWDQVDPLTWLDMTSFIYGIEEFKRTFPVKHVNVHFSGNLYRESISNGVTNDAPDRDEDKKLAADVKLFDYYNRIQSILNFKHEPLWTIGLIDTDLNHTYKDSNPDNGFDGVDYGFDPGKILTFFSPGSENIIFGKTMFTNSWGALLSHEVGHSFGLVRWESLPNYLDGIHSKNQFLNNEKGALLTVWSSNWDMLFPGDEMFTLMSDGGGGMDGSSFFESMTKYDEELDYHVIFNDLTPTVSNTSLITQNLNTSKFLIIGSIDTSGAVSIKESFLTTDNLKITPVEPSDYSLVFLDNSGGILSQDGFSIDSPIPQGVSIQNGTGTFSLVRPYPSGANNVEIRFKEQTFKRLTVSQNPPFVDGISVQIKEFKPTLISWNGGDIDGDQVTYSLYHSCDGGQTYMPIAAGVEDTQLHWDDRLIGGCSQCLIKVTANDGFNRSSEISSEFSLGRKKPKAVILTPSEGSTFCQGSVINLRGAAFDPEDGFISGSQLIWQLDDDVDIGTGETLAFQEIPRAIPGGAISMPLEVGQHSIQLYVTDSDGNKVTSEVTIEILSDKDRDGFSDSIEAKFGGNQWDPFIRPNDLDQDDDGLMDSEEDINGDGAVGPGETDPKNFDTDGDGLYDGLEKGLIIPQSKDTDRSAGVFVSDADPKTKTDPTESDTDNDGLSDGDEDSNRNGRRDVGETDPLNPDTDGDTILDGQDNCPLHPNIDQADFDEDSIGDVCDPDDDNDGVLDGDDACSETLIPESVPTINLDINRFALVNDDTTFDTEAPKGKGPQKAYTTKDTAGCSCEQIIKELGLGEGHVKFGCSISAMDEWVGKVNP